MRDKASNYLRKQQARYKRYFDKKGRTLPKLMIGHQVYVDHPPPGFLEDEKKSSTKYIKLLLRTMVLFTVMGLKSHVITIVEVGIPNTIFIERATHVPTKTHGATRITPSVDLPTRTTATRNTSMNRNGPSEYDLD